jgi:CHAT domain-containing protein
VGQLLDSTTALYRQMAERRFQLATREDRGGADDPRAKRLRADIARLRVQVGLVNAELATRTGGETTSAAAGLMGTHGVGAQERHSTSRPWLSRLAADHVFVEYWLDKHQAYAWTVAGDEVEWVALGPVEDISATARDLHERLRAPVQSDPSQHLTDCNELYRKLIAPLGAKVGAAPYLTIVPDGALNYIPFGALRDPERSVRPYLVQQAVITIAPALRLLAASTHRAPVGGEGGLGDSGAADGKSAGAGDRMLLVADAVYTADDPRVQAAAATLQTTLGASKTRESIPSEALIFRSALGSNDLVRLPATGREAERIRAEYGDGRVDLLGGLDATRDTFLAKDFSTYRFIHIAVHGVIDAEIPQLSALVLGNYGRSGPVGDPAVRAGDLLAKTFNAEAVVLSACDSALGKEYVGEGLIGLRYAALARGAHAVIASLWPVSDGIAADLMTEMYRQIATHDTQRNPAWTRTASENVALSLTTAIRQVLDQTPALDPALWAPFSVYVAGD